MSSDVELVAPSPDDKGLRHRELFLSRVSYAAMEQFLRVSVSFGLTHYRAGLDHCRAELVNISQLARRNRNSIELRRPSLASAPLSLSDIEAYYAVVAGKVPVLTFLNQLVKGLSEVSTPLDAPSVPHGEWVEWAYSRRTLGEALTQFDRQIEAIRADITAIESSLSTARSDQMLGELTESRKLTEIESETPRGAVVLERGQWDALSVRVALFAFLLGVLEVLGNAETFLTERWLGDRPYWGAGTGTQLSVVLLWVVPLLALLSLGAWVWRRWSGPKRSGTTSEHPEQVHVFDYALRQRVDAKEKSDVVVGAIREAMVDIQSAEIRARPCVAYSSFREIPSTGIERVKHSLHAPKSENGASYVLHLEIEGRLGENTSELLRDVRMVVTVPQDVELDLRERTAQVVGDCLRKLILVGKEEDDARRFLQGNLGLNWRPRTQV